MKRFTHVTFAVWGDEKDILHLSVDALLEYARQQRPAALGEIPDTKAVRRYLARKAMEQLRVKGVEGLIIARLQPGRLPAEQ